MRMSEYYGLDMYSDNGNYVGEVEEIFLDCDKGKVAGFAFDQSAGGKWVAVPYENVMAAGEIVIVRSKKTEEKVKAEKVEETVEEE